MNDITPNVTQESGNSPQHTPQKSDGSKFLGLLLMILGVIGAVYSTTVTAIAMVWIGILLMIGATLQFIFAFSAEDAKGLMFSVLLSIMAMMAGVFVLAYPLKASIFFTLIIVLYLFAGGILRLILAFYAQEKWVRRSFIFSGIISLVLGFLIWSHWPVSGLWVIGLFISIELFFAGLSMFVRSR